MKSTWQLALTLVNCKILTFPLKKYLIQYFCHPNLNNHLLFVFLPSYRAHIRRRNGMFTQVRTTAVVVMFCYACSYIDIYYFIAEVASSLTRQAMYVWRNIEARLCDHCCSGKARINTSSECAFVALSMQQVMHMRCIVICDLFGSTVFFHVLS